MVCTWPGRPIRAGTRRWPGGRVTGVADAGVRSSTTVMGEPHLSQGGFLDQRGATRWSKWPGGCNRSAFRVLRGRDLRPWRVGVFPVGKRPVFVVEGHIRDEDGYRDVGRADEVPRRLAEHKPALPAQ